MYLSHLTCACLFVYTIAAVQERRREEEAEARAQAKRDRREQLRREGKLLSAKQKEEAARLAARRAELEAQAQACPARVCLCAWVV